jgi:hypothetical protein
MPFAGGGLARMVEGGAPPPALPVMSTGTGDTQIDNTRALLARISGAAGNTPPQQPIGGAPAAAGADPLGQSSMMNPNNDPLLASLLNANNPKPGAYGGGDNSVASLLMRLGMHHPGVLRHGQPMGGGGYAEGGSPLMLASAGYVAGPSGGQEDKVNARLSDGEYVMDADTVSALGDGNNDAGAAKLDVMRQRLRAHKRSAPATKIPPKAKPPEAYLGKRKKTAASAAADIATGQRSK